MSPIELVAGTLAANALVLAALGYLVRSLLGHRLEKDLSEFKHNMELTTQREIESYKAVLEKERLRLQISYGGIFEKQALAILALHKGVVELERAAQEAVHFGGTRQEREERFREPWRALRRLYQDNRVLIPEEIDEMLEHFVGRMYRGVADYIRAESRDWSKLSEAEFKRLSNQQDRAFEMVETELPAIRDKLIQRMRETMGVAV